MRAAIAILLLLGTLAAAHAFSLGLGNRFGHLGAITKNGGGAPPVDDCLQANTGDDLLADTGNCILVQ